MSGTQKPSVKKQLLGAAAGALVAFVAYQGYSYGSPRVQGLLINAYEMFQNTNIAVSDKSVVDQGLVDRLERQRRRVSGAYPTLAVAVFPSSVMSSSSVMTGSSSSASSVAPLAAVVAESSSSEMAVDDVIYEPIVDDAADDPLPEEDVAMPVTEADVAEEQLQAMVESDGKKPSLPSSGLDIAMIAMAAAGAASGYRHVKTGWGKRK